MGVAAAELSVLLRCYSNKDDFWVNHDGSNIRFAFAMDLAERVPNVFEPELVYLLNSKRWLAECPLRSANDRIIDPECSCAEHTTKGGLWYYGPNCDTCKTEVDNEIKRLKEKLQNTEPPFVLELAQALGSM